MRFAIKTQKLHNMFIFFIDGLPNYAPTCDDINMFKKFFSSHQYKIIIGAPIIFLVIISSDVLGSGNFFLFSTEKNNFPVEGEELRVTLEMHTKTPVNAVGGTIAFDPNKLHITSISRITSAVDLWSEEPEFSNTEGVLHFSGGLVGNKTAEPFRGTIFVISFEVIGEGKSDIAMKGGELLANNGDGTNMMSGANSLSVYARKSGLPSPDINDDGVLSISDANSLYLKTFRAYDARYDLNGDGSVNWADVRSLMSLF